MGSVNYVKGVVFTTIGFLASWFGVFVYGWLTLPLFFIKPILYRKWFDFMMAYYSHCICAMLEILMGVKIRITGDIIRPGEKNLIVMNHRTRLDWMYFWSVLIRQSGVTTEKVILKAPLKKIPGLGWAMQIGAFIFIERKWEDDKKILSKMIDYFADIKNKTQILLFPEGTDLTARTKAKSDEFARKNKVDPYDYVLHPRTTGFTYIFQHMRQREHLDAVYDVTVAYPYTIPQQEVDIVTGNFPEEVHFHIKRYPVQNFPTSEEGLQEWCKQIWQKKEMKLKKFYEKLCFEEDEISNDTGDNVVPEFKKYIGDDRKNMNANASIYMKIALVTWTAFIITISYMLVYSTLVKWIALGQTVFFIFMTLKYGGFEHFQVDFYNKLFRRKNTSKKIK